MQWPILYTNVQSLPSKFNEFLAFVQLHRPYIIFITESWLHPALTDSLYHINSYTLYRDDNKQAIGHRGVCVYVSDNITANFSITSIHNDWDGIDNVFLKISTANSSILIGCVYRPRPCSADIEFTGFLSSCAASEDNIFITGDFNCPDIKWPLISLPSPKSPSFPYAEVVMNTCLQQLVDRPTRFRIGQTPSLLDLFIASDENIISNIDYLPPFGRSDHLVLSTSLQLQFPVHSSRCNKTVRIIDYEKLSRVLGANTWESLKKLGDVDSMWTGFLRIVESALGDCTNYKIIRQNPVKPWINKYILEMIRRKKSLWQRFLRSRTETDYDTHRRYSNSLSSIISSSKMDYERRLATSKNKRKFYKYLRSTMNTKVSVPIVKDSTGKLCASQIESADILSETFASYFVAEPDGQIPSPSTLRVRQNLQNISIDEETILKYLLKSKKGSSPGLDGISTELLSRCANELTKPLFILFSESLATSTLPGDWLRASVTPVFKKGDKSSPSNYRPISLLPTISKILERIISDQLLDFALSQNVLPDEQHGFVSGRSTLTNLISAIDDWTRAWDQGLNTDVVYLDFSRAFDKVPHNRLLSKLEHFGVRGNLLSWIRAFLTNRSFRVRVGSTYSSEDKKVTSGVPQGSVLGPVLFILYTADLPSSIRSTCLFYADDAKIYSCPQLNPGVLQRDLDLLGEWCDDWLLPLNLEKCCVMHIGHGNSDITYRLGGRVIQTVTRHSDLGLLVADDLTWTDHIASLSAKARKVTWLLQKNFNRCDIKTAKLLYETYVRPIMEYAGPAWWVVRRGDAALLESIQRWNTRIPYGWLRPCYEERLQLFGLTTFAERRGRGDIIVTYRAINGHFGESIGDMFVRNQNHLRGHSFKLAKEKFKTTQRQFFLSNRVFDVWNGLPPSVVNAPSVNAFKNRFDSCGSFNSVDVL